MAWRIEESVLRGELDNRIKGMVRGKIWLDGRIEPLELHLTGNACADLAGCLLTFINQKKQRAHPPTTKLDAIQRGRIGDLTASRKVRVFDIPVQDALRMIRRGEKPPEHMANSLYLEWFSNTNGRVVIESTDYELTISEASWRLTAEEEKERATEASHGMNDFLGGLSIEIENLGDAEGNREDPSTQ